MIKILAADDDRVNNLFMLRKLLCLQMRIDFFFINSVSPVFHNNEIMALKCIKDTYIFKGGDAIS